MSQVFFSSDLHFNHRRVAESRGFDSVEAHDDAIVERWNKVVGKRDTTYLLGDLAMSTTHGLEIAQRLRGRIILVAGNHDACHPMHRRSGAATRRFLDVFADVKVAHKMSIDDRDVMLSHFPYQADRGEVRYPEWRLPDAGLWLLHGHTHSDKVITGPRELHVGWDAWRGPVSRDTIAAIIAMQEGTCCER